MAVIVTATHEALPVPAPAPAPVIPPAPPAVNVIPPGAKADTVMNFNRFARIDYKSALYWAIMAQMDANPLLFDESITKDAATKNKYADTFAAHMLDKLSAKAVLVLNETSVAALKYVSRYLTVPVEVSVKGLYKFLFEGGEPKHNIVEGKAAPAPKPAFKGC